MTFFEYLNQGSRNLSYVDLKLIGWAGVVFGLWVGKIIPVLTSIPNPVLIVLFILLMAKPLYVWLRRR
jgi:MFS-type transporter involved in bile tolerance (Atg22 family)